MRNFIPPIEDSENPSGRRRKLQSIEFQFLRLAFIEDPQRAKSLSIISAICRDTWPLMNIRKEYPTQCRNFDEYGGGMAMGRSSDEIF